SPFNFGISTLSKGYNTRKTLPLTCTREGISNFGLPLVVVIDGEVTVSNKHPRFLEFDGNLHPLTGYAWLGPLLLLKKSICLWFIYPLPALVFGDLGVITIGYEFWKVRISKVSQAQSGCLDGGEIGRHRHPFPPLAQSSSGRILTSKQHFSHVHENEA